MSGFRKAAISDHIAQAANDPNAENAIPKLDLLPALKREAFASEFSK